MATRCNLPSLVFPPWGIPSIPVPNPVDIIAAVRAVLTGIYIPSFSLACPLD